MDSDKLFELTANKSIEEIEQMEEILSKALRLYASRYLMDNDEEHFLECYFTLPSYDYGFFGLSELQKPHVVKLYQANDGSGYIFIHIDGDDEDYEFDDYSLDDRLEIVKQLSKLKD